MAETDIIFFDATWNEAEPPTYGSSKDLYAIAEKLPDNASGISTKVSDPTKNSDSAT